MDELGKLLIMNYVNGGKPLVVYFDESSISGLRRKSNPISFMFFALLISVSSKKGLSIETVGLISKADHVSASPMLAIVTILANLSCLC